MKDTNDSMMDRFQDMLMKRKPEERLRMGCSMFDTAKEIVKSSIINNHQKISSSALKIEIFLRFYGTEFDNPEKEKIINFLENHSGFKKTTDSRGFV